MECSAAGARENVMSLIRSRVIEAPDAIAVEGEVNLTYRELWDRVERHSYELKLVPGNPNKFTIFEPTSKIQNIVSMLGTFLAGAVYVPIDPLWPEERLRYVVDLLGNANNSTNSSNGKAGVDDSRHHEHFETKLNDTEATSASLSYLLFTSGSRGMPKGVLQTHEALLNLVEWQMHQSQNGPSLRTALMTPSTFDVSIQEICSTLAAGGTLVEIPDEARLDPPRLERLCSRSGITRLFMPPIMLRMLAESTAKSNSWNPDAISICEFICAGDKLIVNDAIRSYALGRKWMKLINQYGPTETHVVMSHSLSGDPGEWPTEPPIGLPISGVFPSIRERNGESVETGELVIEGKCVAAGYVGATSQDESRFSEFNRSRSYSTGDCVSTDEFGVFQFLGRLDRQIKLRGHRIEPDGIESVLESLPGVLAAAVDIFGEDPLTRKLVAVVVSDEPLSAPSIRRQLGKIFPPYSVPNEIRITPALPKSSSGKVDHQALIQLEFPFEH